MYNLPNNHESFFKWLLTTLYVNLCNNIIEDININDLFNSDNSPSEYNFNHILTNNYDEGFIYRSYTPDFITGNESQLKDYKSIEYKNFMLNKIKHFIGNEYEYKIKPSLIIILQLHSIFPSCYPLMMIYNRALDNVKYASPEKCYYSFEYIKDTPSNKIMMHDKVLGSAIYEAYNILKIPEFFFTYLLKIFNIKNYALINSEIDYLDTYDLEDQRFNNLKYMIFEGLLYQWLYVDRTLIKDLSKLFDISNIPTFKSARFSIYMAWALSQKILGYEIEKINIIDDTTLNINKLYNYFITLLNDDSDILPKLIQWIKNYDWSMDSTKHSGGRDEKKLLEEHDINNLFNSEGNIYKTYYDYISSPESNIKIKDAIDDEYIYEINSNNITNKIEIEYDNDNNDKQKIILQKGGFGQYIYNHDTKIISIVPVSKIYYIINKIK